MTTALREQVGNEIDECSHIPPVIEAATPLHRRSCWAQLAVSWQEGTV